MPTPWGEPNHGEHGPASVGPDSLGKEYPEGAGRQPNGFETAHPDFEMNWPYEIFRMELGSILAMQDTRRDDMIASLLREAFVDEHVSIVFENIPAKFSPSMSDERGSYAIWLRDNSSKFPISHGRQRYWIHREGGGVARGQKIHQESLQVEWRAIASEFERDGYFRKAAPRECADVPLGEGESLASLDEIIFEQCGLVNLWDRSRGSALDNDELFTLIEVMHTLIARPRYRWYHDWDNCGWHYEKFSRNIGQMLYRWKVNALLERRGEGLRIAREGQERGTLIRIFDDAREGLVRASVAEGPLPQPDEVQQAIALYRKLGAQAVDKRTACFQLARVLEARRPLMKEEMLKGDEGMIFQIANKFNIRHSNKDQFDNYDEVFLDWIFWTFLATCELTRSLEAKRATQPRG